jgi:hypothetical protein
MPNPSDPAGRFPDSADWSIEQAQRQFDEQAEGLPKAFIVNAVVLDCHAS